MNERLDRLEQVVEKLADGMVVLQSAMTGMVQTVEGLAGDIRVLQSAMTGLVQSVEGLSATVERFIRGMEGNGHRPQSS